MRPRWLRRVSSSVVASATSTSRALPFTINAIPIVSPLPDNGVIASPSLPRSWEERRKQMTISRRQIGAVAFLALGAAAAPALAESSDQAAVAEAIAALTKAMLAADKAKLEALLSDNLSYGHSSGKIETKKEVVDV